MYSHILATLDGSPLSESVLPQVEKLAAGSTLRVTLLAVAEDPSPISSAPRVYPERLIDATGSLQEAALQEMDVHREGETHEQAILRVESELLVYL
jgi:nucleotide-binding universal stress UspA family protein